MAQELSSLASEVGMEEFKEHFSILEQLRDVWQAGGKALVQNIEEISDDHNIDVPCEEVSDDIENSSSVQSEKEKSLLEERSADFTSDLPVVTSNQEVQSNLDSSEDAGNKLGDLVVICAIFSLTQCSYSLHTIYSSSHGCILHQDNPQHTVCTLLFVCSESMASTLHANVNMCFAIISYDAY